jgi:uncharacterized protein
VDGSQANALVLTYWGNDRLHPDFTLTVDGKEIASETLDHAEMNRFFDREYALPSELTKGKTTVVIRIQPKAGKSGPSVAAARVIRS